MSDELVHPDEALRLVIEAAPEPSLETVALAEALGRALPRGLVSRIDQPPFDKSAMDGYAYDPAHPADLYKVLSVVAAGFMPRHSIDPGECARIMTGAPLPPGAGAVQRVEWSEPAGAGADGAPFVRFTKAEPGTNVILRGENLRAGASLLGPRVLAPQDIGVLASSGYASALVAKKPRVAVISTGSEICEAGKPLPEAAIYDSNGPQLVAQARAAGCETDFLGIVADDVSGLEAALKQALGSCDVVIVSGGVSRGDFDYVPKLLETLGVERIFYKVAIRPGKPIWFGRRGAKTVFGLPGNPVSTFVNFEFFVRPHLTRRMGIAYEPRLVRATLASAIVRRDADRVDFLPARLARDEKRGIDIVGTIGYRSSSMLNALAEADCLVRVELGRIRVEEGEKVDVRLLRP